MDYFQILPYKYQCYNLIIRVKNISQLQLKIVSLFTKNLVSQHNILTSAFCLEQKTDSITIKSINNECQKKTFAELIFLFSQLWHPSITTKHTNGLSTSNTKTLIFDKSRFTCRKKICSICF